MPGDIPMDRNEAVRAPIEGAGPARYDGDPTDDVAEELCWLPQNDLGNAERFRKRYGGELLYVRDIGWHVWDGKRWDREQGAEAAKMKAHQTALAIRNEVPVLENKGAFADEKESDFKERVAARRKFASGSGMSARLVAMVTEAQPYLTVAPDVMDADPMMLTVNNGTLKLDAEVQGILDHDPGDKITKVVRVAFQRGAHAPKFQAFLERIVPDEDVRGFLQRWFGYCLTGLTGEQVLVFFYGTGANGKSTLLNIIALVLGPYSVSLPFQSFQANDNKRGGDATPDLARLPGARLLRASEPERGAKLSEALIKALTGGEEMPVRRLRQDFFDFTPEFKAVLSGNHKPRIAGQDEGIWRRVLLVPFLEQIPKAERIRDYHKTLFKEEGPGILNWMLDGLAQYLDSGLDVPKAVFAATDTYRKESDPLGRFITDCIRKHDGGSVQAKMIYQAYCKWCTSHGEKPWSQKAVGMGLGERGWEKDDSSGWVFYTNMELLEPPDADGTGGDPGPQSEDDYGNR